MLANSSFFLLSSLFIADNLAGMPSYLYLPTESLVFPSYFFYFFIIVYCFFPFILTNCRLRMKIQSHLSNFIPLVERSFVRDTIHLVCDGGGSRGMKEDQRGEGSEREM